MGWQEYIAVAIAAAATFYLFRRSVAFFLSRKERAGCAGCRVAEKDQIQLHQITMRPKQEV